MLSNVEMGRLIAFSVMLSAGQVLFKLAAVGSPTVAGWQTVFPLLRNPWLWLALILYGTATLLWVIILQRTPLSLAYPFVAIGFGLVPLAAWLLFGEVITWRYVVGVAFIAGGAILVSRSAPPSLTG